VKPFGFPDVNNVKPMHAMAKKALSKWPLMKRMGPLAGDMQRKSIALARLADEELMLAFQKGEAQAFSILLKRHQKPVFNFIYKYLKNTEAAEEAFQEVFLRIIRTCTDYQPSARFTTWLYTVARNYCIDQLRKHKFRNHISLEQNYEDHDDVSCGLHHRVQVQGTAADVASSAVELGRHLDRILAELTPEQKEVFILREFQGLKFEEIAKITGTSANTVKSRMRYALKTLQKRFQELGITKSGA
jgi:RNA polymerase sigma-70 factor (ECF subfamily)